MLLLRGLSVPCVLTSTRMRLLAVVLAGILPAACAVAPRSVPLQAVARVDVPVPAPAQDELLQLLAGQFALHEGNGVAAARHFAAAASLSRDPAVAAEAARLAFEVRDPALVRSVLERWQALAPDDGEMVEARARLALDEGDDAAALALLEPMLVDAGASGWRRVGRVLLASGDRAAAARVLAGLAVPARLGGEEGQWIAVSQLAFRLGDKERATRLAAASVERFHGAESMSWSARLAVDRGDRDAASAFYREALRLEPGNRLWRGAYAGLLAEDGADAAAARVLAGGAQDDASYAARAALAVRADDQGMLGALYREVQADASPRGSERLVLLGRLAELLERRDEAIEWYRAIPAGDASWFEAQVRQVIVLDQAGRTDDALALVRRLEQALVGEPAQLVNAYLLEIEVLVRRERHAEVRPAFARGFAALPEATELLYARALFEVEQGDVAAGERDLRRVLELKPDNADAMNALGYTLADHARPGEAALEEAGRLIARALELKPGEAAILDSMGWWRYRNGEPEAALPFLRDAFERQVDAEIAAHLGEVLWVLGRQEEARRVWDQGREKDAENRTLRETIRRLTR